MPHKFPPQPLSLSYQARYPSLLKSRSNKEREHQTSNMFPSSSFSSQDLPWRLQLHSRRLLSHQLPPYYSPSPPPFNRPIPTNTTTIQQNSSSAEPSGQPANNRFDANVVMVLSVLLCALICSLGLNSIIRCALRCSTFVAQASDHNSHSTQENDTTSTTSTTACSRLANTGIRKKALKAFTTLTYSPDMKLSDGLSSECVICLAEFAPGDKLRFLPKCNHGFHARCIDRWLNSHSSCPTCRNCLIDMPCQKTVGGCNQDPSSSASQHLPPPLRPQAQALPQGSAVADTVMPLQGEDPAPDHLQGSS